MGIQTAVSASTLTPGTYMKVNLIAGAGALGAGALNILLIAPKSSAGTLTPDTEIRAGGGESTANTAFGPGTGGHLAAKQIYAQDPAALVDFVAPTAGTGAAALTVTLSGTPTADNAVVWTIMGRVISSLWANGASATTAAAAAVTAINSQTTNLAVTASNVSGAVTLTFKVTGKSGNDCLVQAVLANTQSGTEAVSGAATPTNLSGGSTDFDVTTAIANAEGKEYHLICLVTSNADATSNSATSNPRKIATAIAAINNGRNAKLEQCILATTAAQSAAKTGAINLNNPIFELINCVDGQSLPGEFAGFETGSRSASDKLDPAANRIGTVLVGLFASFQPKTDTLTLSGSEDALHNGVTPVDYQPNGTPFLVRPITTYSQDPSGAPDVRCLDVQNVSASYIVARDIRDNLPLAFPNAKISKNFVATSDPPAIPGITEERDIYGWVAQRLLGWATLKGVLDFNTTSAVINGGDPVLGQLVVVVDPSDATQVDIVIPWLIVKPLAKFSEVINRFN